MMTENKCCLRLLQKSMLAFSLAFEVKNLLLFVPKKKENSSRAWRHDFR
jgi:hypothetical protein